MPQLDAAGLAALALVASDPRLVEYEPYWAARAELLARTGATQEADEAYLHAIGLESDPAARRFVASYERHGTPVGVLGWNMPKQARLHRQQHLGGSR